MNCRQHDGRCVKFATPASNTGKPYASFMYSLPLVAITCLLTAGTGLAADADIKEVTAVSQNGGHRLRLTRLEQTKSPWDETVCAVSMTFRLEFAQEGEIRFLAQPPENVYLEAEDPLVEAFLLSGENVANHKHSGWTDRLGATVSHLELGKEQKQLQKLKLSVTLVKLTEWEELEFKGLKKGDNDLLHCGPFELACKGEAKQVALSSGAHAEFSKEHEQYQKQMPLKFLTHRYAIDHVSITDARNRALFYSVGSFSGGGSSGVFSWQRFLDLENATEKKPVEPIAYPITLKIKLPKRYEKERVMFEFDKLDLPALK